MQGLWKKADLLESKGPHEVFRWVIWEPSYSQLFKMVPQCNLLRILSHLKRIRLIRSGSARNWLQLLYILLFTSLELNWQKLSVCTASHNTDLVSLGQLFRHISEKSCGVPRLPWSPVCSQEGLGIHCSTQFRLQANPCPQLGSHSRTRNKNKTHPL